MSEDSDRQGLGKGKFACPRIKWLGLTQPYQGELAPALELFSSHNASLSGYLVLPWLRLGSPKAEARHLLSLSYFLLWLGKMAPIL